MEKSKAEVEFIKRLDQIEKKVKNMTPEEKLEFRSKVDQKIRDLNRQCVIDEDPTQVKYGFHLE